MRSIPTEIPLDRDNGLTERGAASFDNLQPIHNSSLTSRVGSLPYPRQSICRTLAALADCRSRSGRSGSSHGSYTRDVTALDYTKPLGLRFARAYARQLWGRREFIFELSRGNAEGRSSRAALGRIWWVLNPLIMSGVYFIVFGLIITGSDRSRADFLAYLIIGIFVYRYLSQGMLESSKAILNNEKLIVNIPFPRLVLPLTAVLESLFMFLVSLPVLYLLVTPISCLQALNNAAVTCVVPTWRTALLPIPIVLLGLFTLGVGSLVARWVIPVRDFRDVVPHLTRVWFYFSPVLWGTERLQRLPQLAQIIIKLNPMYSFLALFRFSMIGEPFDLTSAILAPVWAIAMLVIGVGSFVRNEIDLVRYL